MNFRLLKNHRSANALFSILFSLSLSFSVASQAQEEELSIEHQQVSPDLYMLSGVGGFIGGNIAVWTGEDGVMVIDNGVASVLELLRAEIAEITDQPVSYLINTHVHGDHIGNNEPFGTDGAQIISHRNLRAAMLEKGIGSPSGNIPAPKASLPIITFSDQLSLNINGDTARLIHLSAAHTDGDSVIFFENANVLHTGDIMFNKRFPYIDTSNGGSLDGVIEAQKAMLDIGDTDTKIIPGHGPMASKADLMASLAMLEDSKEIIAKMVAEGKSEQQILAADPLKAYQQYSWGFINTERMIKQLIEGVSAPTK